MQRLFQFFQPQRYNLTLDLRRTQRSFSGTVTIHGVTTTSNLSQLRLHAKDLHVTHATIDQQPATATVHDDELNLETAAPLSAGEHSITIAFSGKITDPMHGLYPCYFKHDGEKKELLATQFESHHAREVFPCIDEPEAKATFDVTLETETGVTVLGNMPVKKSSASNNRLVTAFETTPRMSTYLLAFVVGDLHHQEATTKGGVLVRVFATVAQPLESIRFALKHAVDTIDFFDGYFGTPYPLPKSDHVALPDFSSGAMENWGLITYRETALLANEVTSSISHRQYAATVITHELSHQWFGNLVTMKWWDDLWLNESFATIMEYVGINALHPEWDPWLDFGTNDRAPALHRDMLPGVQAVRTGVSHPDEISTLFDPAIVYAKGGTVLRMLLAYIGEPAFRAGLQLYFERHKYGNTTGHDLWAAFAEASGQKINDFMAAWLEKPGYPIVSITQDSPAATEALLSQQRLLLGDEHDDTSLWPIPLFATDEDQTSLLVERTEKLQLSTGSFMLLNHGSRSLFVSHYRNAQHRQWLAEQLQASALAPADRLRLLHDSLLVARAGKQHLVESLKLALANNNEKRDAVWDVMALIIGESRRFIEHNKVLETSLKAKTAALVAPQLELLGYVTRPEDELEVKKRRASLFGLAVWSEYEPALSHALHEFERFKKPGDLDTELRSSIYIAGGRWQGETAYKKLFTLYKQTVSAEEKQELVGGLTATPEGPIIARLLAHIKDSDVVKPQDVFLWFAIMMRKFSAREQSWHWLETEWSWIEASFNSDKSYDYFPRIVSGVVFGEHWLERYKTFFEPKRKQPALTRVITIGIDEVASRTALYEREYLHLKKFLS